MKDVKVDTREDSLKFIESFTENFEELEKILLAMNDVSRKQFKEEPIEIEGVPRCI